MITGLRVKQAVLLGLLVGIVGTARGGMITSFSSSGPGGTTTLAIDPLFPGNVLDFSANFTAVAPIFLNIGVDGPDSYFFFPGPNPTKQLNVTNATGAHWTAFDITLIGAPPGSLPSESIQSGAEVPNYFGSRTIFTASDIHFSGAPGVSAGGSTGLGAGFVIAGSGPATFQVELAPSVPEPSAIVLFLSASLYGLAFLTRRARRSAKAL